MDHLEFPSTRSSAGAAEVEAEILEPDERHGYKVLLAIWRRRHLLRWKDFAGITTSAMLLHRPSLVMSDDLILLPICCRAMSCQIERSQRSKCETFPTTDQLLVQRQDKGLDCSNPTAAQLREQSPVLSVTQISPALHHSTHVFKRVNGGANWCSFYSAFSVHWVSIIGDTLLWDNRRILCRALNSAIYGLC